MKKLLLQRSWKLCFRVVVSEIWAKLRHQSSVSEKSLPCKAILHTLYLIIDNEYWQEKILLWNSSSVRGQILYLCTDFQANWLLQRNKIQSWQSHFLCKLMFVQIVCWNGWWRWTELKSPVLDVIIQSHDGWYRSSRYQLNRYTIAVNPHSSRWSDTYHRKKCTWLTPNKYSYQL